MNAHDHATAIRELAIETLAQRVLGLEDDVSVYRTLLRAALDAMQQLTITNDRLRERNRQLRDWNNQLAAAAEIYHREAA